MVGSVNRVSAQQSCPCGSGQPYGECCGPLLDGREWASTAEQLMRSRYTAFAVGNADHLFRTWHPRTRPATVEADRDTEWAGLTIIDTVDGGVDDTTGVVEFEAVYRVGRRTEVLGERSRFARRAGRWMYLDQRG